MEELIAQCADGDEDARLTRQYIAQLEFDTTMHLMTPYLQTPKRVCELGAATGRYSLTFAGDGHAVTAVELVPQQIKIMRDKAQMLGLELDIHEGNACEVPFIESNSQDICVVLGPLYHLKQKSEREQVISEAKRILKPGGVLAVAYISRFFVAGMFAQKFPNLISARVLEELHRYGTVSHPDWPRFFRVGYFATPEEIETLVTDSDLELLEHAATDGFSRYLSAGVNDFTPSQYQAWLEYHLQTCKEPSLLGASNHGLLVAQKRE
ncbi:biotin synthesis protein bioC [Vibrio ishigakensis]|uniref:Biotin synthesis protein bioC n=1 Tax=Vibrio ishigakensis TaxID=1481914 RepID=A0A0B8QFS8_9VIBR|nr:biotin synthesis protein bioC [Vibrio ishigakensis]